MLRDIKCFLKQFFFFPTISNLRFLYRGKFETQKKRKEKAKKLEQERKQNYRLVEKYLDRSWRKRSNFFAIVPLIRTRVVDTCVVWIQGGAPVVYRYIGAVCISDYSLCEWTCHVRAA